MDRSKERELWIVRHGETAWNRAGRLQGQTDIPLSERGREQATALAERLVDRPFAFILTSDLSRARETGAIVNARRAEPLPALLDPDLRERLFGSFEGLDAEQCRAQFPAEYHAWRASFMVTPPGGEPWADLSSRVMRAVTKAFARLDEIHSSNAALVVTHGVSIRAIMLAVCGQLPTELVGRSIGNCEVFRVASKSGSLYVPKT